MDDVKISVVIPMYNAEQYIRDCIESIVTQSDTVHEIILIDDGSTDGSSRAVADYIKSHKVKYYYQENAGLSAARNRGVELATGDYIAFLDSDDIWASDKIEKQKNVLRQMPEVGLVHTNISCIDEHGQRMDKIPFDPRDASGNCFDYILMHCGIVVSSTVIPRSVLEKVGLFSAELKSTQDYELFLRIAKDHKVYCVEDTVTYYRQHSDSMSKSDFGVSIFLESIKALDVFMNGSFGRNVPKRDVNRSKSRFFFFAARKLSQAGHLRSMSLAYLAKSMFHDPFNADAFNLLMTMCVPGVLLKNFRWYKARLKHLVGLKDT